jgi:glycosyltransferase involved in cell wall biosynthesis
VLPVTQVLANRILQERLDESKVKVIPNGTALARLENGLSRQECKRRVGVGEKLVLGFSGFVREWHGLETAIDFLADVPRNGSLHLLVVGDGPARQVLERRASERAVSSSVTFTGVVGRDTIRDYVAAFDIAIQPAVVPYACPLKLFDYMAAGCAIVAPRTPNIQEILTDGESALLFDLENPRSFAEALERLCSDPKLRDRLGKGARQAIFDRRFTWEANAERVTELAQQCLNTEGQAVGATVSSRLS